MENSESQSPTSSTLPESSKPHYHANVTQSPTEEPFFGTAFDGFDDEFEDDFFKSGYNTNESSDHKDGGDWDPSTLMSEEVYCSIVNSLDEACWEVNPTELWSYNRSHIYNLTGEEIIRVMNHQLTSPIFGRRVNYTAELGGKITRNEQGEIIGAEAIRLKWVLAVNLTAVEQGNCITDFSTGETADEGT